MGSPNSTAAAVVGNEGAPAPVSEGTPSSSSTATSTPSESTSSPLVVNDLEPLSRFELNQNLLGEIRKQPQNTRRRIVWQYVDMVDETQGDLDGQLRKVIDDMRDTDRFLSRHNLLRAEF